MKKTHKSVCKYLKCSFVKFVLILGHAHVKCVWPFFSIKATKISISLIFLWVNNIII